MNDIFGIPMTTILIVLVAIMSLCLVTTASIALRNRVIFRLAVRNVPRRRAQTILIIIGLMLSTLIISAALTTGDTIAYSATSSSYQRLGEVDETIAFVGGSGGKGAVSVDSPTIPASTASELERRLGHDPDIEAIMPVLTVGAPVANPRLGLSEPSVVVTGLDPDRLAAFGGLQTPDGEPIGLAAMRPGSAIISRQLADKLDARIGDRLTLTYGNRAIPLAVAGVARGSILTGDEASTAQAGPTETTSSALLGIAVPLAWLQDLTGLQGQARFIAVSNRGGVEDGVARTDAAVARLRDALARVDGGRQLGVNPIKQDGVRAAEQLGNRFMTFFVIMGLFSVAAGILLIFLIFMMLAVERRAEMGMARAIGMTRGQLIQGFIAEGVAYDLGAALIGAAAGVLVAFAVAGGLAGLIGRSLSITPHATWRSLVVAYALGVTVTFVTVIFASVRSSRLNIVAAIRDLPDHAHAQRDRRPHWRWWARLPRSGPRALASIWLASEVVWNVVRIGPSLLVWLVRLLAHVVGWGPIVAGAGALFLLLGVATPSVFWFSLGISLIVLGLALVLRRVLPARLVYTAAAAFMLLYWLLPFDVTKRVLPDLGDGGPEMFFLSGIFMVTYATLIILWNADLIVGLAAVAGRFFSRWLPATRTAVAYPMAARGRTGLTVAMFAMVIFAIVTVKTINANFIAMAATDEADAGWDVAVATNPANPVDDLRTALTASGVDLSAVGAIGRVDAVAPSNAALRNPGDGGWTRYPVNGLDDGYVAHADIPLKARAPGYASDAAVWDAIRDGQRVAVIDQGAFDGGGSGGAAERYRAPGGVRVADGTMPAFEVELQDPRTGKTETITVVGVIDTKVTTLTGLYLPASVVADLYGAPDRIDYYVQLRHASRTSARALAKRIESSLRSRGVQAESIRDQIAEEQALSSGFFTLLQGFMGLGLLVGIAALGVISFRSVVERRQQIGMLRAIGYQRGMVTASFLLESLVIALLGVLSGAVLAVILSHNLITGGLISGEPFDGFVVPWPSIVFFVAASLVAAAVMTWIPARQAASVPIAEALRYE